jgi:dTDP-N-acetylfucosamine:lipid II N-acetylfucosaminyltransferase
MTKKLLHLAKDEKFLDAAIALFEAVAPGQNTFAIRLDAGSEKPRFVRSDLVTCFSENSLALPKLKAELGAYSAVVLHGMDSFAKQLVAVAPGSTRFLWLSWGFDIYNQFPIFRKGMFQPQTRRIVRELSRNPVTSELRTAVKSSLFRLGLPCSSAVSESLRTIRRMWGCASVLPDEWATVRQLGFNGQFFRFNYAWLEQLFPAATPYLRASGPNILVGNSSTASNNHVDTFHLLRRHGWSGQKIVVPLSYGSAAYKQHVLRKGREIFGDAFTPLQEFMPLEAYNRILENCGTVVMNQRRQQAVGNIIASLHMGARVFLNEYNPCHTFFSRAGTHLFSLQRDADRLSHTQEVLPDAVVEHNRACLRTEYSHAISLERASFIASRLLA